MDWSPETMDAMQSWLASATAYNWGPHETDKLNLFVAHVWHDQRSKWDEGRTREIFRSKAQEIGSDPDSKHVLYAIQQGLSNGTMILEFLTQLAESDKMQLLTD